MIMSRLLLVGAALVLGWAAQGQRTVPFPTTTGRGPAINSIYSATIPGESARIDLGLYLQSRVMYDRSNLAEFNDLDEPIDYDYFRQRIRLGTDFRFVDTSARVQAGAYAELEYRGGWGGSSPIASDPRAGHPTINPFNFLQARGVRYGYVYAQWYGHTTITAGILPLTDAFGGVLFDADWDFNVGGLALGGPLMRQGNYRLAFVRLVEGVSGNDPDQIKRDGNLWLAEKSYPLGATSIGAALYHMRIPEDLLNFELSQTWFGVHVSQKNPDLGWKASLILNTGKVDGSSHTGMAASLALDLPVGSGQLSMLGLASTGDGPDEQNHAFLTPHVFLFTRGYWAKTHIFTPSGPSDTNDFGLEIGNRGAGLLTAQVEYGVPLRGAALSAKVFAGWFGSSKARNGTHFLGAEAGGLVEWKIGKYLGWEMGGAFAIMGDFYNPDARNVYELFSRFQFEW